ncbi:phospholactate guanylyltransferase [Geoglobus ahangari]|uniref:2-phospho-L-lactate guanylyltransferase n=1 Tax=Geoglobus ahangari TaxID=113653 RepID=A0A0F7DC07_9EURY|nr:2-phospho-L-lactate guanylyltransferase [Geoglobus ahangari]AKG92011.1 phospholactate guanylyltransferase [Geoglobus ahangari]
MEIVIPFKPVNPKTRLSGILTREEREELAFNLLLDVVDACGEAVVISSAEDRRLEGLRYEVDSRSLDEVVTSRIKKGDLAVVMSDLPLLNERVVERFLSSDGEVVLAPGRKGGTNMLLSRSRSFRTSYHYGSFVKHVQICESLGLKYKIFDSFYASVDIDDESDLLELMIHGKGKRSYEYLEGLGFYVDFSEKDPMLKRS